MAYLGTPIDTQNQFQSLQGKRFSGDASTTGFTLDIAPSSVFDIEVFVENVRQDPNSAYSISGTTLTFSAAPPSGTNNIYVVHQAKAVGTIDVPASSVVPASLASNIISGQTALAANPATDDELLISDAGTIKRIDAQFFQNTPAFEAYLSADATPSNDTFTKIAANTEVYDTDNAYDNSSNYRFTPQVAGKYFVYVGASTTSVNNMYSTIINFTKNGSGYKEAVFQNGTNASYPLNKLTPTLCGVVELNGSSDYIESNVNIQTHNGSSITLEGGSNKFTYFGAYKIIGA